MENIGERIKRLRSKKNMTLEELGNQVGVGKSTVRKWETGMIANKKGGRCHLFLFVIQKYLKKMQKNSKIEYVKKRGKYVFNCRIRKSRRRI